MKKRFTLTLIAEFEETPEIARVTQEMQDAIDSGEFTKDLDDDPEFENVKATFTVEPI